jgi:hypothetical protein
VVKQLCWVPDVGSIAESHCEFVDDGLSETVADVQEDISSRSRPGVSETAAKAASPESPAVS